MIKEFIEFLKEYKVVSLATAFVMAAASTSLVNSLVKDVIMPIAEPLISDGLWREAVLRIGPVNIAYGSFLAESINFIILAVIVFLIAKKLFKIEKGE
jgi:large conductance mechanosensitive channel